MHTLLSKREYILAWLDSYRVRRFRLRADSTYGFCVDVRGDVDLNNSGLEQIAVKFGHIEGSFSIRGNRLTNLVGAPHSVAKSFECSANLLSDLSGAPTARDFFCSRNRLTSLLGAPETIEGRFDCSHNLLPDFKGICKTIGGNLFACNNDIQTLRYFPEFVGKNVWLDGNVLLGQVRHLQDFAELKILADKAQLEFNVDNGPRGAVHKL